MEYSIETLSNMLKPTTTYSQQIAKLESRGLKVTPEDNAEDVLSVINYYYITGYLHSFRVDNGTYIQGLTFKRIVNIIYFDIEFRNICMKLIDIIERCLKTKIAYHFSHEYEYGNVAYLYADSFDSKHEFSHQQFIKLFNSAKNKNKDFPFVIHHNEHYEGYMPIWVATDLFTMGNIEHFYRLLNTQTKKKIAENYGYGATKIGGWIESTRIFRNLLAHSARLYNRKFKNVPKTAKEYPYSSMMVFDYILTLKYLTIDIMEWMNFVSELEVLFEIYSTWINLEDIGFPDDWKKILLMQKGEIYTIEKS